METKEILRKERGITLVALIITIIVLIILAAVSINAVLKTDFIGLATNGTINYAEAQVNEQKQMDDLNDKLDDVIAKIDKVSSPKPFAGYMLSLSSDFDQLYVHFLLDECAEFLKSEINRRKNSITDEEIFMAENMQSYNGTFEQLMEEAYNAGEIPEKYKTLKEFLIKGDGATEAQVEEFIANMRKEYFAKMNAIDTNNINASNIKIITPEGNTLINFTDHTGEYPIPIEVKEHIFQIEYEGQRYEMKINIKPYELVTASAGTNPKLRVRQAIYVYVLDVKNKNFLTINSAKVNVDGKEINLGSEYLVNENDYNYLNREEIIYHYNNGALTNEVGESKIFKCSLTCNEGIIQGYFLDY